MVTKTIDVNQTDVETLIALVRSGEEIVFTDHDKPLARLVPIGEELTPRVAGLHPNAMVMSPDFNDPLPDEFWLGSDE